MKRGLLFLTIGILSGLASFALSTTPRPESLLIYLTYPNIFIAFVLFCLALFKFHRTEWRFSKLLPKTRFNYAAIGLVSALLLLFEPFEFKIIYDEALMAVAAELIHFARIVGMPTLGNDYDGSYQFLQLLVEKRPFFFPFVVSLIHDLFGYRYINVFFLNAVLTPVFLIFLNFLGCVFGGNKGGILAVCLAGSFPLLATMASSGNLEILNLVMLCLILILSLRYLETPKDVILIPLVYTLILFFQIRYENGIFLIPFGIIILIGWRRAKECILPWQVMVSPIFLILPALHYLWIAKQSELYFQSGPSGRQSTFSLDYFSENVEAAGSFLFSVGQSQSNSFILTILGISSCILFLYYYLRKSSRNRELSTKATVLLVFYLSVILHLFVVLIFNYGIFTSYLTARLSLPLGILMILTVPFVFSRLNKIASLVTIGVFAFSSFFVFLNLDAGFLSSVGLQFAFGIFAFLFSGLWVWRNISSQTTGIIILTIAYIITIGVPVGRAHRYSSSAMNNDTIMEELNFIKARENERILWISPAPYAALLSRVNCLPISAMNADPASIQRFLDDESYDSIYISRRLKRSRGEPFKLLDPQGNYDKRIFKTSEVMRAKFGMTVHLQIEKILSVNSNGNNEDISNGNQPGKN